jgi:prevent-host-death family protein
MTIKVVTMKPIQVSEDILPIASFKAHASEVVRSLRARGRPMIITQNGRPAAVLLSPEEFDRLTYREGFRAAVREGLADAEAGRVVSDRDLDEVVEGELGKRQR